MINIEIYLVIILNIIFLSLPFIYWNKRHRKLKYKIDYNKWNIFGGKNPNPYRSVKENKTIIMNVISILRQGIKYENCFYYKYNNKYINIQQTLNDIINDCSHLTNVIKTSGGEIKDNVINFATRLDNKIEYYKTLVMVNAVLKEYRFYLYATYSITILLSLFALANIGLTFTWIFK